MAHRFIDGLPFTKKMVDIFHGYVTNNQMLNYVVHLLSPFQSEHLDFDSKAPNLL